MNTVLAEELTFVIVSMNHIDIMKWFINELKEDFKKSSFRKSIELIKDNFQKNKFI